MWLMLVPVILCAEAVHRDLNDREIPDRISLILFITGLVSTALSWHTVSFLDALLGVLVGFVVVLPFTLRDGIGGGDLKLIAALGAWLGVTGTMSLLFWTAISGVVAAVVAHTRKQKDFAYAPAILAGLVITLLWPTSLTLLVAWLRG